MTSDNDSFPFYSYEDLKSNLTILLYHGVTASTSIGIENYSGKHMNVDEFYRQMSYIKDNCNILSMDEIVDIKKKMKCGLRMLLQLLLMMVLRITGAQHLFLTN